MSTSPQDTNVTVRKIVPFIFRIEVDFLSFHTVNGMDTNQSRWLCETDFTPFFYNNNINNDWISVSNTIQ